MTTQDVVDACWNYATSATEPERERIAERIAAHLHADPDRVAAVLTGHRRRVSDLYDDARQKPSLVSLERADEDVADALSALPEVEVVA